MTQKLKKHLMKMQVQVICYEIDALFLQLNPNLTYIHEFAHFVHQ